MTRTSKEKIAPISTTESSPRRSLQFKWIFFGIMGMLLLLGGVTTGYAFFYSTRIMPHTQIAGIEVGGLHKDEALRLIQTKEQSFKKSSFNLSFQGKQWKVAAEQLDLQFHNDDALSEAYAFGRQGSFSVQMQNMLSALFVGRQLNVDIASLTDATHQTLSKLLLQSIETQPAETTLSFTPGKVEVIAGKAGKKLDYNSFEQEVYRDFKDNRLDIALSLISFQPEVNSAMAEPARVLAEQLLASDWVIQASSASLQIRPDQLADWLSTEVERGATGKALGLKVVVKQDPLRKVLADFANKVQVKAVNAVLKTESGGVSVSVPEKDGLDMSIDPTIELMNQTFAHPSGTHTITAITQVHRADLRQDTLASLGIKELIGSATTDFSGSPSNRIFNISLGQRTLNGGFLKDGEVYSTTATLGPVDISTGYLPELVIVDNRTTPEAGGGLCQVSTTLFRAVLNAGLPVVERTNHAYRVGYYEREVGPGLDATVYIPEPDFKWKNDTGHAVYIQSSISGTKITFELYGTKDGRVSTISKPQILAETPPGDTINVPSDTLFKGETKQIESPHPGAKTLVTYIVSRDGKELNHQDFYSNYKPWPRQILVGTKDRPVTDPVL